MTQAPVPHSTAPDYDRTLVLAIELSNKSWVLAAQVPGLPREASRGTKPVRRVRLGRGAAGAAAAPLA